MNDKDKNDYKEALQIAKDAVEHMTEMLAEADNDINESNYKEEGGRIVLTRLECGNAMIVCDFMIGLIETAYEPTGQDRPKEEYVIHDDEPMMRVSKIGGKRQ